MIQQATTGLIEHSIYARVIAGVPRIGDAASAWAVGNEVEQKVGFVLAATQHRLHLAPVIHVHRHQQIELLGIGANKLTGVGRRVKTASDAASPAAD